MKRHLTQKVIEQLLPPAKRCWYTDDATRGLTLAHTPNGIKTFYAVRKHRGKVKRHYLGRFPELSLADAKVKASKIALEYDQGMTPLEARALDRTKLTLDAFYEIYYRDHLTKRRNPVKRRKEYERLIRPWFGHRLLTEIAREDIEGLMRDIGEGRGHRRTANIARNLLRTLFNKALQWEHYSGLNPAGHITPYPEHYRTRYLQQEEIGRFHEALQQEPNETIRDVIQMLLFTAARKSNVLSMRWSDLDLERGLWRIHGTETKTGDHYAIQLSDEALKILHKRRARPGGLYVFPGKSKRGHLTEIKGAWSRLLDRAGIEDLWIHDLRRTLASWMGNLGASPWQIAKQLAHKDLQSTQHYVHIDPAYVRPKLQEAARLFTQHNDRAH